MLSKVTQDALPPQDTVTSWAPGATGRGAEKRKGKAWVGPGRVEVVDDPVEVVVELWVEGGDVPEADPQPVAMSATPAVSRAR